MAYRPPEYVKWYKTANWQRLRFRVLARNPLCVICKAKKIITPANVVDHKTPHKGDMNLFFDIGNLQSLCKHCHDGQKQKIEKSGIYGCDENGIVESWK